MKYRIVKTEYFELSKNYSCKADFVPEKEWITTYSVESKPLFGFKWEHRREFTSEAQALLYLEYLQQKPKVTVIK
jgi:hypothetical protein